MVAICLLGGLFSVESLSNSVFVNCNVCRSGGLSSWLHLFSEGCIMFMMVYKW